MMDDIREASLQTLEMAMNGHRWANNTPPIVTFKFGATVLNLIKLAALHKVHLPLVDIFHITGQKGVGKGR
ncbi:hypothetical protein D3C86_1980920 [compost metagenome]